MSMAKGLKAAKWLAFSLLSGQLLDKFYRKRKVAEAALSLGRLVDSAHENLSHLCPD